MHLDYAFLLFLLYFPVHELTKS